MKPASLNAHAALRGLERGISPDDIRTAINRGSPKAGRRGRVEYRHGDLVVVYDPMLKRVVTTFRKPEVQL